MVQRGERGKLKKGSVLNPKGRPKRKVEEEYLAVFRAAVSKDDWLDIINRAILDAKRGDPTARKFVADYLIGAPVLKSDIKVHGDLNINWDEKPSDND